MSAVYDRTELLLGREAVDRLKQKRVLLFGLGGVGGSVAEALARVGIGTLGIVDFDRVDVTNINRQIIALHSTVGRAKTKVMEERIGDINPAILVIPFEEKLSPSNAGDFFCFPWDYVVDAIDDVPAKVLLIAQAKARNIPVISSMGTGNHFDPGKLTIADINKTHTCPLARRIRKETGMRGIKEFKVLFSSEQPMRAALQEERGHTPASIAFVPAAAGLLIAAEVVKDLLQPRN